MDRHSLETRFAGGYAIGGVVSIPLNLGKPLPKAGAFAHGQAGEVARNIVAAIVGSNASERFNGHGECFIETGDGKAGVGGGDCYAEPVLPRSLARSIIYTGHIDPAPIDSRIFVTKSVVPIFAACLLWMTIQDAEGAIRMIDPGTLPALAPDEGLLVIRIDTPERIGSVQIRQSNSHGGHESIDGIAPGKSTRFFAVTAGTYQWSSIDYESNYARLSFALGDDKEFHFQVKPGVINYPGDLVYRPHGLRASVHVPNRGLSAIDWVRENYGAAYRQYHFFYTGHYADPFPDFYRIALDGMPATAGSDLDRTLSPPDPGTLPIPVEDLWRPSRIQKISLSPDGKLLAEEIYENNTRHIDLIDLQAETVTRMVNADTAVAALDWAGNRALLITLENNDRFATVYAVRIGDDGANGRSIKSVRIPELGWVIGAVPDSSGQILFASRRYPDEDGNHQVMVHRLDVTGWQSLMAFKLSPTSRLDHGVPDALNWLTDGSGRLRAAVARRNNELTMFYGADGKYAPLFKIDENGDYDPIALSNDGNLFYILSDRGRAQRDLIAYDPITQLTTTVFSKAGVDIDAPVFDAHRKLIGAAYFENGMRVVEYFDQNNEDIARRIATAFPGSFTNILDRDETGKRFIVSVGKADQPVRFYDLDVDKGVASLLEESAPWLDEKRLASSIAIHTKGSDGLPIEAYLTLPVDAHGKSPLIVYSHGGPIGVRDTLEFDPAVQLFASLGYAVLQVNFRGSDGYGRAFREAGRRHYGSLIEDDIDAATRMVLQQYPIDSNRICAVGSSYGGYSALVSAIRWPQRFRCAVSISGVSDQLLMFTASDAAWSESGRSELEKAIGNPVTDADSMRQYAPLYRYQELKLPVMLAHGTEDVRVDYEHSRRLVRMLNLAGRPPVMMALQGESHGDFSEKTETRLWNGVAGFLRANLNEHTLPASPH